MTKTEVANLIESFLDGSGSEWDWDDFLHTTLDDPELKEIQRRCNSLSLDFPPEERGHYCGAQGVAALKKMAAELRQSTGR